MNRATGREKYFAPQVKIKIALQLLNSFHFPVNEVGGQI
jgi:hypothetical protein